MLDYVLIHLLSVIVTWLITAYAPSTFCVKRSYTHTGKTIKWGEYKKSQVIEI